MIFNKAVLPIHSQVIVIRTHRVGQHLSDQEKLKADKSKTWTEVVDTKFHPQISSLETDSC